MLLQDLVQKVRSGVFHLVFFNSKDARIGSGSAFLVNDYLITNNHVFSDQRMDNATCKTVWIRQEGQDSLNQGICLSYAEFRNSLVTGSDKDSYDYAVLDIPALRNQNYHQFSLAYPQGIRIGDAICFLGYPLEHNNLTCHQGIISSFYSSNGVKILQIDASVNSSNSGGPLLNLKDGTVIGIITRKATGLTKLFDDIGIAIKNNISLAEVTRGMIIMENIDVGEAIINSQIQMQYLLNEIERSANVGIGYAFSTEYLINENCMLP